MKLNHLQAKSQVEIVHVHFHPEGKQLDEYVEIKNRGELTIDISGWKVEAGSPDQVFVWPQGSYLSPFETISVYTKSGSEYSFNSKRPIWNNRGDVATLTDASGEEICGFAYGDKAHHSVLISHIEVDGKEKRTEGDEFVELTNVSESIVDIDGWRLKATRNDAVFVFPKGVKLEPSSSIRVFTNKAPLDLNEFSFNSPSAIWNNQRGGCKLLDYKDREVSSYHY
ncbi:lamin tail domain-containing protein [Grimontia sp. S25]|uniref:Lamin tail domain-containing protein n=2 Tax=Grimontia sedimenti TaxID=2711294 RepID=A0A6M1RF61_9GAMM|nr:lamin tail domain-containing protein [Grimontia sedimenti]NGN96218.1 lamin tail domain-containing protein [Grimontia sedimenti]